MGLKGFDVVMAGLSCDAQGCGCDKTQNNINGNKNISLIDFANKALEGVIVRGTTQYAAA